MNPTNAQIKAFQKKILNWYKYHKRDFPWRNTTNPYHIHVSEIMLQQTQAKRVIPYYNTFLTHYPSLETLSQAPTAHLLQIWQGLGYNNRVIRLRESAKKLIEEFNSRYPQNLTTLQTLPGVGDYTSAAILAFAFNKEVPVIDTNIRRLLIYEFNLEESISKKELKELAYLATPKNKAREWNNALMDYSTLETSASVTGIKSKGKQGKFEGSTRQVRSSIIKELLAEKTITISYLISKFPNHDIEEILETLKKDNVIQKEESIIYIKEL